MKENNVVTSEANRKLCQGWEHDDFQRKQCTNQKNRPFGLKYWNDKKNNHSKFYNNEKTYIIILHNMALC